MGRNWAPKYTDKQRDAVAQAIVDYGLTGKQTVEAALAGTLPGSGQGLAGFAIPETTTREFARKLRQRRRGAQQRALKPDDALTSFTGRLMSMLDAAMTKAEKQQRAGKLNPADMRDLARAAIEADKLVKQRAPTTQPKAPATPTKQPVTPNSDDFLATLATDDRKGRARSTKPTDASYSEQDEGDELRGINQPNGTTAGKNSEQPSLRDRSRLSDPADLVRSLASDAGFDV